MCSLNNLNFKLSDISKVVEMKRETFCEYSETQAMLIKCPLDQMMS